MPSRKDKAKIREEIRGLSDKVKSDSFFMLSQEFRQEHDRVLLLMRTLGISQQSSFYLDLAKLTPEYPKALATQKDFGILREDEDPFRHENPHYLPFYEGRVFAIGSKTDYQLITFPGEDLFILELFDLACAISWHFNESKLLGIAEFGEGPHKNLIARGHNGRSMTFEKEPTPQLYEYLSAFFPEIKAYIFHEDGIYYTEAGSRQGIGPCGILEDLARRGYEHATAVLQAAMLGKVLDTQGYYPAVLSRYYCGLERRQLGFLLDSEMIEENLPLIKILEAIKKRGSTVKIGYDMSNRHFYTINLC